MEGNKHGGKFEDLRRKAEEALMERDEHPKKLALEIDELIHELEVHQIELEMQNEDLIKTQIQLEDSRMDYMELYDFAPVGYFTFDKNWVIKRVNLTGFVILGIPRKHLINNAFIRFIVPDSRKTFYDHCQKVKKSQVKEQCELELVSPDKNPFFASLDSIMVLDKAGEFKEFRTVVTDITERKIAELELVESEKKFHLLFDDSPLPYQSLDDEGNFLEVNPAWCACMGYSKDEVIGRNFTDFLESGYDKHFQENFSGFKETGEIHGVEFRMKCHDGKLIDVSFEGKIGYDESGNFKQSHCIFQDITQRKKAEKKIEEFNNQLKATIEAIPDLMFEVDEEGRFYDYNAPHPDLLYIPPESFIGKTVNEVLPSEAASKIMEALKEASEKGKHRGTAYKLDLNGDTGYFELSIARKPIPTSKPHFIALVHDITQRKKAEKQIKEALKEKEILLKEIHHRVKNNLMVISSLLNLQADYVKDKASYEMFMESKNRARSMALIHERLYQSTDLREIDFSDYIRTLSMELYRTYVINPEIIRLNLNLEPITVDINIAIPCGLIINELLSNSLKHAFPGNRSGEVDIKFHSKEGNLILEISDDGIGFPQDIDFNNTPSLGLKVVNVLVDQIDGEIKMNSGKGTSFTVTFPEVTFDEL